jgi:anti-sigma regulatory factor (Ser/Thr protein kinase)
VLAIVHPRADLDVSITLAVAGHPLPLLRTSEGDVRAIGSPGTAVGITESFVVSDHDVVLHPGDTVLCFTDGATERRNGPRFFGEDGLAEVLRGATGDSDTIAATIQHAVAAFADDDLSDDLALLVVQAAEPSTAEAQQPPTGGAEPLYLPKEAASAAAARRYLSQVLHGRCPPETADIAILLASELVTNAVRYGLEPITIDVRFAADAVTITVSDTHPALPRRRDASATDVGGRGLQLLEALSDEWGHVQRDLGKDVWFTLRLS